MQADSRGCLQLALSATSASLGGLQAVLDASWYTGICKQVNIPTSFTPKLVFYLTIQSLILEEETSCAITFQFQKMHSKRCQLWDKKDVALGGTAHCD